MPCAGCQRRKALLKTFVKRVASQVKAWVGPRQGVPCKCARKRGRCPAHPRQMTNETARQPRVEE
jgi:hypothetical protein